MTSTATWRGQLDHHQSLGHHQSEWRDYGHPTMRGGRSYNDYTPYSHRHTGNVGMYSTRASYGVWSPTNTQISHEGGGYYNSTIAGPQPPNTRYNYSYQQPPPQAQFYAANCFIYPPARGVPIHAKFNRNYY